MFAWAQPRSRSAAPAALPQASLVLHPLGAGTPLPAGRFVALAPGADVPILPLDLPQALKGAAREAVALRQVAERLGRHAGGVEMRPCRFPGQEQGWSAALVMAPEAVAQWRQEVAPAAGRCLAILPDYLALPAAEAVWTVDCAGTETRVRLGLRDGFAAEPPLAALLLDQARLAGPLPRAVLRLGPPVAAVDAALTRLAGVPLVADSAALPHGLGPAGILTHGEMALDLTFDPTQRIALLDARIRAWRLPLLLLAAAALCWTLGSLAELRRITAQEAAIRAEASALVRQHFLPEGPILDITAQVTREIERRRASAVGAPLLAPLDILRLAAACVQADGAARVLALARRPGEDVTLELVLPDFAAQDRLTAALRARGLAVVVASASAGAEGQVTTLLRLTAAPAPG